MPPRRRPASRNDLRREPFSSGPLRGALVDPLGDQYPAPTLAEIRRAQYPSQPAFEYRGDYWFSALIHCGKLATAEIMNRTLFRPPRCLHPIQRFLPHVLSAGSSRQIFWRTSGVVQPGKGKRTHDRAQLCLTNPKLRDFVVQRVKEWLRESPHCEIMSVTQNDWDGHCDCPDCKALDDAEGESRWDDDHVRKLHRRTH